MATLVTGGTGFVASNIARLLAEQGEQVICFDIVTPFPMLQEYIKPWSYKITFVQGDLIKQEDVNQLMDYGITKIVHAAVFTGVLPEVEAGRSRSIVETNFMGTTNLLEIARQLPMERFVYVSSGSSFGPNYDRELALDEDSVHLPRTLYGLTKYASELLTRRYGELHGFPTATARIGGSPFGPMERVTGHRLNQGILKTWTGNIARGEPIEVADRAFVEAFTYVTDIANGIIMVLQAPSLSYDDYNVAGEERRSRAYIIQILEELNPDLRVVDVASTSNRGAGSQPAPASGSHLSSARLRNELGFVPQFDLRTGIEKYLAWRQASGFTE